MSLKDRDNEQKPWIDIVKSKGHNYAENYLTGTKVKLGLRILVKHQYSEFQFKIFMHDRDN